MTNQTDNPLSVERSAQLVFAATLAGIFLIAGSVMKNERAVFLTEGTGFPAKAFASMVPPGAAVYRGPHAQHTGGDPSRGETQGFVPDRLASEPGFARAINGPFEVLGTPSSNASQAGTSRSAALPDDTILNSAQLASLASSQFMPTVPRPSGGGAASAVNGTTPPTPPISGAPSTPVTPTQPVTQNNPANPINPTTPTAPATPIGSTTPSNPVSAVPETATWEMLLLGFLAIGIALRRRSAKASVFVTGQTV